MLQIIAVSILSIMSPGAVVADAVIEASSLPPQIVGLQSDSKIQVMEKHDDEIRNY